MRLNGIKAVIVLAVIITVIYELVVFIVMTNSITLPDIRTAIHKILLELVYNIISALVIYPIALNFISERDFI